MSTHECNEIEDLLQQQTTDIMVACRVVTNFKKLGTANFTLALVNRRVEQLKEFQANLLRRHSALRSLVSAEVRPTLGYYKENQFTNTLDKIDEDLDYFANLAVSLVQPSTTAGKSSVIVTPNATATPRAKLPPIELPKFDGSYAKWETFRDRFTSLIISDSNLSKLEKMHYLCSALSGEPLDVINHLSITEANFDIAWTLIKDQYDNERRIIMDHLRALFSLNAVRSNSVKAMRSLRDTITTTLQALRNFKRPVDHWDDILVYIVISKLDNASRSALELKLSDSSKFPTYHVIDEFLQARIRMLDALSQTQLATSDSSITSKSAKPVNTKISALSASTLKLSCIACKSEHPLYKCPEFLTYNIPQRRQFLSANKRCFNCFRAGHSATDCSSHFRCRQCTKRHHTLLHLASGQSLNAEAPPFSHTPTADNAVDNISSNVTSLNAFYKSNRASVLLATATVKIYAPNGDSVTSRALLDQGSEATFVTSHVAKELNLVSAQSNVSISGIGCTQTTALGVAKIGIGPLANSTSVYHTDAFILPNLTNYPSSRSSSNEAWPHLSNLDLADKDPFGNAPCDIIIGADLYGLLLRDGIRSGRPGEPVAQNTVFGWILSGKIGHRTSAKIIPSHHITTAQLENSLQQFWAIENIDNQIPMTPVDQQCEEHFSASHSRNKDGRYVVRLPFKANTPPTLPPSFANAFESLKRLEKRLSRDPIKYEAYRDFLREYEALGHMQEVLETDASTIAEPYYIPHHAVFREDKTTTRLRVVFNASSKTSNGKSLNDYLHVGSKLQNDLGPIIIRWRQFQYVLTADLTKMYRQILMHFDDTDFQRILWRNSPNEPLKIYRLLTITYGTAPAAYLALRSLKQLIIDEGSSFPLAVRVIDEQSYVDDHTFGAHTRELALQTRNQLIDIYHRAGFTLHKWASNDPVLLLDLNGVQKETDNKEIGFSPSMKVLGILWHPNRDEFGFKILPFRHAVLSKRTILSSIASLFDPLGWIAPVIITAKILMQKLWQISCGWDVELPVDIREEWKKYSMQLPCLERLFIPRWTGFVPDDCRFELHGFADASEKAYGAVVYIRVQKPHEVETCSISLLIAKTRVAPLKVLSIPRLELCAALLLIELIQYARDALKMPSVSCHCWSDSRVALAWISQSPSRWDRFVANRVAKIQEASHAIWHYVPSIDNPADCASRGIYPNDIMQHKLWWSGPSWLRQNKNCWPPPDNRDNTDDIRDKIECEQRANILVNTSVIPCRWDLQFRYSSWNRLLRITAIVMRFVNKLKNRMTIKPHDHVPPPSVSISLLSVDDIHRAEAFWIRQIQLELFASDLSSLKVGPNVPSSSRISALSPYIDSEGILRVQGRLRFANISENQKHPIILSDHPLVRVIVSTSHVGLLHAGPRLLLAHLRNTYWILRARSLIRSVLHKCVTCARARAQSAQEFMGDLPSVRVNASVRAFVHTGVDYAGPIPVRNAKGRNNKTYKAYIAIFVCMTIKAIHIELVSDYSSEAFIAAYKRFIARRGIPASVYCDNGTNFHGADRELTSAYQMALQSPNFIKILLTDKTQWRFIPPVSPHFGGLWEASVKSVKTHLKKCIGTHVMTYEELSTLLCSIEACLNSRPLTATSDCLDDYNALTPGHFLIQGPLIALPEPNLLDVTENRLSRWQLVSRMQQQFWHSWRREYLHTLQQRPKWRIRQNLIKKGQIVLLRDSTPPSHWPLARIIECHPGHDGLTREVTVQTPYAKYKRPITQICLLPIDINREAQSTTISTALSTDHLEDTHSA